MKKNYNKSIITISMLIISLFCFSFLLSSSKNISTLEMQNTSQIILNEDEIPNNAITNDPDGIIDENLYNALINIYNKNQVSVNDRVLELTSDMFIDYTELDLSNYAISFLSGLEKLELPNLKILNLQNNLITSIDSITFSGMNNLEELNLSSNNLSTVSGQTYETFPSLTNLTKLKSLNLYNNNLENLDLSWWNNSNEYLYCDLSSNIVKTYQDIKLNNDQKYKLDLTFNLIDSIDNIDLKENLVDFYFQNIFINSRVMTTGEAINIFSGYSMPNFNVKVYQTQSVMDENNQEISTQEVLVNVMNPNSSTILDYGTNYTLKFFNDQISLFDENDYLSTSDYNDIEISVKPLAPSMKFYYNEEEITDLPNIFTQPITIKFSSNVGNIIYSINGTNNYVSGDTITISESGYYRVSAKVEANSNGEIVSSDQAILFVKVNIDSGMPNVTLFILALIGIFLVMLGLRYIGNHNIKFNSKNKKEEEKDD